MDERSEIKGLVFDIRRFTVHDGPGIRTTVFLKGCLLNCAWCHNPESQSMNQESSIKTIRLDGSIFREAELAGTWMNTQDIAAEVEKDRIFYEESGGGISISGGEPLAQPAFLMALLKVLKERGFHICLDTCGYADWQVLSQTVKYVDLYLYDLKVMDESKHLMYTGVSNKPILDNLKRLAAVSNRINIRIPVVEEVSHTDENFNALVEFLVPLKDSVKGINLLPYHSLAGNKYKRFGKTDRMQGLKNMPRQELESRKAGLEALGFEVKIGG